MWSAIKNFFGAIGSWFSSRNIKADVDAVQNATVQACGFLPTAATVGNILAAGDPNMLAATAVATAICAAVTKPTAPVMGLIEPVPTVNGVPIEGTFVKKP